MSNPANSRHLSRNSLADFYQQIQSRLEAKQPPPPEPEPVPDPIEWIQTHFYIPETNAPIQLAPYQQQVIREALSKDENGLFHYSTILWSDIKKSAKSTIAGAVALYLAWHTPFESVRIVANDLKQADSRTFYYIERAILLNPVLKEQCKINRYEITLPNNTVIQAIPVDPKGEAGGGDLVTCFTELWAYKNDASKKLWVETALSPLKFGKSLRWCETYAGYDGESPILEQLYEQGVTQGERLDADLELYRNGRLLALWNTRPRLPWQTDAYYQQEAAQYVPSEFERIHRNKWARSTEAFVPVEWWDACQQPFPEFGRHTPMVIAIDAGVSGDCFAMIGISRVKRIAYTRYVNVWTPPENGGQIDFEEPRKELERLVREHNVECCVYDPFQMTYFAQLMIEKGTVFMQEFPQTTKRAEADKALYDAIREHTLAHNGDATLKQHVMNANRKAEGENKLRIVKRQESMKIDAIVAASMAHHTAVELELN